MENKKTKNGMEERKREDTLRSWRWRRNDRVIFNVRLCGFVKYRDMNLYVGVEVWHHAFLKLTPC